MERISEEWLEGVAAVELNLSCLLKKKKRCMVGTINADFQLAESQMDTVNAQYIVLHLSLSQIIIYIQRQSNTDCATHHLDSDGTFESSGSHGSDAVQVHRWVVTQHRLDFFCWVFFGAFFIFVYLLSLKRRAANVRLLMVIVSVCP